MIDRVLFVDDEKSVLDGIRRLLHGKFELRFASSPAEALTAMHSGETFAVVVSDMRMPGMDGVAFLDAAAKLAPDTVRIMLTGNADQETAVRAVNLGRIFSFLNKPVARETLVATLDQAIRFHRLTTAEKELLERTLAGSIRVLVEILSSAFPETFERAVRIREAARNVADALGGNAWRLDMAAMLAPLGWATIPTELVQKVRSGAELSAAESRIVRRMPESGARLIANIPRLESVAEIVRLQDRAYDGGDGPADGLVADGIPLEARILKLVAACVDTAGATPISAATIDALAGRTEFDPALIAKMRACLAGAGPAPEIRPPVEVQISDVTLLNVGDILASDLLFDDGSLALAKPTRVTEILRGRLHNFAEIRHFQMPVRVLRVPTL